MTTSKINHHDIQHRISSSKRTMTNHCDPLIETKTHVSSRTSKPKHNCEIPNLSSSKPESIISEEIHTAPLTNEGVQINSSITRKHRTRHGGTNDYIPEDIDEESSAIHAIMTKTKTSTERRHHQQLSSPSNNSAIHLQQEGMVDHYQFNTKQHKNRNKTTGKYHQELDKKYVYRWRLFMYILILIILVFVIYRFLLAIWPKPKKTFMEQLIDDLSNFFTP